MARPHQALIELAAGRHLRFEDATALVDSAAEHRMSGLLLEGARAGRVDLAVTYQRVLAAQTLATRAHHERLWRAFESAAHRLEGVGIEVALAKGIGAERRWYDGIGQRPCADLDLMLKPDQVAHVRDAVRALQPDHKLLPHLDQLVANGDLESVDVAYDGVSIDLHFDIMKLGIPVRGSDAIWQRTEHLESPAGNAVRVLDPETSLILFLLHLLKDRFSYLLGFVDVVHVLEREDIDWGFVDDFLGHEGLSVLVYETLDTVYETLSLPNPRPVPQRGWRRKAWQLLWPERIRLGGHSGRVAHHRRQFWFPFLMPGRELDGIKAIAGLAFPPRTLMDHYHPDTEGPYLWRLAVGRMRRTRERRILPTASRHR